MIASGVRRVFKACCLGTNEDRSGPLTKRRVIAAGIAVGVASGTGFAQDKEAGKDLQWDDFAEVYTDRYIEPYEHLKLNELGQARSHVLALYAMGRTFEEQKKLNEAIEAYREVLEIVPGFAELSRKVGFLLAQNGKPVEGRKVLEESLAKNPDSPHSYIVLSEYLATFLGKSPENRQRSVELAEEAVKKFPGHPDVYDHIVKTYLIAGEPQKAQAVMIEALKRDDPNPFYWLRVAETAKRVWPVSTKAGAEPVRINGIYDKALERAPDHPMILEKVADHYRESRQSEKARKIYEQLIKKFPDRLDLRKDLASVFAAMGKNEERIETLKGLVQINPQDVETHRELGRIYEARQDREEAIIHYQQALRIAQGSVNEYYDLGVLMIEAEQAEEAARLLERGAYLFPSEPIMPIMLTHAYSMLEKWEKAAGEFDKAVELGSQTRPDMLNDRFYFRYGAAVERAGDIDRAATLFRKSIDLLSENSTGREDTEQTKFRAQLYNYLGYMWIENDMNIDEGGALIQQANQLDPNSGAIADSLGWFYFKKGKYEDARRELLKAVSLVDEPDAVIHDHLGRIQYKLGDLEEALAEMKKAVELDPENKELQDRLKQYEKMSGEKEGEKPKGDNKPAADQDPDKPKESPEPKPEPEPKKDAA